MSFNFCKSMRNYKKLVFQANMKNIEGIRLSVLLDGLKKFVFCENTKNLHGDSFKKTRRTRSEESITNFL